MGSVIQKTATLLVSNETATSFTKTNAFPSTPTVGNGAAMLLSVFNVAPASNMSVTIGGTAATLSYSNTRGNIRTQCWHVSALGASPNRNIVVTFSGAADYKYISFGAVECSPLASSPVDIAQGLLWFDSMDGGWPIDLTGAAPTAQADELLLAMAISGSGLDDCLINTATGFTELVLEEDANNYQGGAGSYKLLTTVQTPTASFSKRAGTTADHWDTILVSLKFAEAANTATAAITLGTIVPAATATSTNVATSAITASDTVSASTASLTNVATSSITLAGITPDGTQGNQASATLTLEDVVAAGQAVLTNVAEAAVTTDVIASGTALLTNVAAAEILLGDILASGGELVPNEANAAIEVGAVTVLATAGLTNTATASITLSDATVQAYGGQYQEADMLIEISVGEVIRDIQVGSVINEIYV